MAFDEDCAYQISRLSGLNYFPRDDGAVGELVRALEESCAGNIRLAAEAITEIVDSSTQCPTPREIRDTVWRIAHPGAEPPVGNMGCPSCHGAGFVLRRPNREKWEARYPGVDYDIYADKCAVQCECRKAKASA